jgi:hypothetical protein
LIERASIGGRKYSRSRESNSGEEEIIEKYQKLTLDKLEKAKSAAA